MAIQNNERKKKIIHLIIGSKLCITGDIPNDVKGDLKMQLTMTNPEWIENEKRGFWNRDTPKELLFYEEAESGLLIPRGYTGNAYKYLKKCNVQCKLNIQTRQLPDIDFNFNGTLKPIQKTSVQKILSKNFGVAQMPTGTGKTVVALYCVAKRKQPALVIVHTKELLYQWKERAEQFLGLKGDEIGLIGDGNKKIGTKLTIAIQLSLYKMVEQVKDHIGFLIVDECHRVPAPTFEGAVSKFDCKYMLGLSATPERGDGLTKKIYLYLGDRVCEVNQKEAQDAGMIMPVTLEIRDTEFDYDYNDDYQAMIAALTVDQDRNKLIADDVVTFCKGSNGPALVMSDRKAHCHTLGDLIQTHGFRVGILTSKVSKKNREKIIGDVNSGNIDVLIATSQLLGEGFDCESLLALFLATPISSSSKLTQVIGRILRIHDGKDIPVIFDYRDKPGVLRASFHSRVYTYQSQGIILPN